MHKLGPEEVGEAERRGAAFSAERTWGGLAGKALGRGTSLPAVCSLPTLLTVRGSTHPLQCPDPAPSRAPNTAPNTE